MLPQSSLMGFMRIFAEQRIDNQLDKAFHPGRQEL
jgi:hypothetical protein